MEESDRLSGIAMAFAFHGFLFAAGSLGFFQKAEYGMDFSKGVAEVDLVAAPAPMASAAAEVSSPRKVPPSANVLEKEDVPEPEKAPTAPAPIAVAPTLDAILHTNDLNGPLGDGSSPIAGTDATTQHHPGASGSYFKPGYTRNPPPPYPDKARRLKQEGRVLLEVTVTAAGTLGAAQLKKSSGFPLLDEAALKGITHWRFRPARMGGLAVQTVVEIPIRFQLK